MEAVPSGCVHGYKDLAGGLHRDPPISARRRRGRELAAAGIMTKRYFFPAHRMEAYRAICPASTLPVTDNLYERTLCIPIYHDLTDEQIDLIGREIRKGLRRAGQRFAA